MLPARTATHSRPTLQRIREEVSGKDLKVFFKQWLYQPGHPKLTGSWRWDSKSKSVVVEVSQSQPGGLFQFPLEIGITGKDG